MIATTNARTVAQAATTSVSDGPLSRTITCGVGTTMTVGADDGVVSGSETLGVGVGLVAMADHYAGAISLEGALADGGLWPFTLLYLR